MITNLQVTFDPVALEFEIIGTSDNAAGSNWYVGLVGPAGEIKALDLGASDGTGSGFTLVVSDISPAMLDGDYEFEVRIVDPGGYKETQQTTYTLAQTGVMSYTITNTSSTITFKDSTAYPAQTGSPAYTRDSLVTKPVAPGSVVAGTVSFTTPQASFSMALGDGVIYENVTWAVVGTGSGQFTEDVPFPFNSSGNWTFIYTREYAGSANKFVVVTTDPCGFLACLDSLWQSLVAQSCQVGGLAALAPYKAEQMALMLGHASMYNYWASCDNVEQARYYYEQLSNLGDCTISTTPRAVSGPGTPGTWVQIPAEYWLNSFADQGFYYMVSGGLMFFRGVVNPGARDTAGLEMIDPAYWGTVGIMFDDRIFIPCIDAGAPTAVADLYYARTTGNTITVYDYSTNAFLRTFGLAAPIPIYDI